MCKMNSTNGDTIYLPCLAYHLPTAEICLISPQTYHQFYGGCSEVDGDKIVMHLPRSSKGPIAHSVVIPIEKEKTNLPMVYNVACTDKERQDIGPHLRSSLARHTMAFDATCTLSVEEFEFEFQKYSQICCPCVADD